MFSIMHDVVTELPDTEVSVEVVKFIYRMGETTVVRVLA